MSRLTIRELARLYKAKRDQKARLEARMKQRTKAINDDMELLARLMDVYLSEAEQQTGKTTIPTDYGTVYRQEKVKYVMADREKYLDFLLDDPEEAFKLLTNAVASTEIKQYIRDQIQKLSDNGAPDIEEVDEDTLLPPGVEARRFHEVVLRAK